MRSWIILSGEYPPKVGGLADHVHHLAIELSKAGDEVDVWAPPAAEGELVRDPGVTARALPDRYGPRSLLVLEKELAKKPDARILVEYVPHAFGWTAMNVPFALWLAARRRPVWIQFQEVSTLVTRGAKLRHNFQAVVMQGMASIMARRADRIFVSTPAWNERLRRLAPGSKEPIWLPDPSNIPDSVPQEAIALARARLGLSPDDVVIGCFSSYEPGVTGLLAGALPVLLERDPRRIALLMGRGSKEAAEVVLRGCAKGSRTRLVATGKLDLPVIAAHLASCAAAIQPYPEGVTTRRTSAMNPLALGVPLVTNTGPWAEPLWGESGAVALAPAPTAEALIETAERVLSEPGYGAALGARGREFHRSHFSFEHVVSVLRQP
jgi:glycosyltransferase involved in cell wall biosynthesis